MDQDETAIQGWTRIAAVFGVHRRTMMRRAREMERAGIIFYRKVPCLTKSGSHFPQRCVFAFPYALKMWAAKKSIDGEKF